MSVLIEEQSKSVGGEWVEIPAPDVPQQKAAATTTGTTMMTGGTGIIDFKYAKEWISDKPLYIRGAAHDDGCSGRSEPPC